MNSRMEKYVSNTAVKERTKRNEKLYDEVLDMNIDYVNINVNNAVELDPNSSIGSTREDYHRQRELNKILPKNEIVKKEVYQENELQEDRIYDINEILNLARRNKLFEDTERKRLINTEYNILTKLDLKEIQNEEMKKEDLRNLIDNIYSVDDNIKKKNNTNYDDELFKDLMDDNDLKEEIRLKEELSKEILDNGTNSINLNKTSEKKEKESIEEKTCSINKCKEEKEESVDASNSEEEEYVFEVKEGKGLLVAIIIVSILILLTIGFFVYEYFFGI